MLNFESDQFRFARLYDESLLGRLHSSEVSQYSSDDIKRAQELLDESETLLEIKTRVLQSLARCMGDTTETDVPADGVDVMTVWFSVRDEMQAIADLQELIKMLNRYVHEYELVGLAESHLKAVYSSMSSDDNGAL